MFTRSRLVLARKSRGLSLVRLAELAEITTRSLSSYENGKSKPTEETLGRLAAMLGFPVSFFMASDLDELPAEAVSFRAVSKLGAAKRDTALSLGRLAIELHEWIDARFRLPSPDVATLTQFSTVYAAQQSTAASYGRSGPELAAEMVRARWGLGNAPISNVLHLLEAHGVRVCSLAERCADVDAFSLWWQAAPYVFFNTRKTAERGRFDAAHELGHLVLHGEAQKLHGKEAEREADRFAAAFLMPRDSVIARLPPNPSLQAVVQAKKYWKVAAIALAHRLYEVGLSTEWHYRTTCIELARRGYRSAEPSGASRETSQVLNKVFRAMRSEGVSPANIAGDLHLAPNDLSDLVFGLVVTSISGNGESGGDRPQRPQLNLVR
jgi:Zn-dependent peptidase ImmA (M78 family)/transcriptional regulator with XRE-family HTH domain